MTEYQAVWIPDRLRSKVPIINIVSPALIVTETRPIAVGARHFRNTAGRYFDLHVDCTVRALPPRPELESGWGRGGGLIAVTVTGRGKAAQQMNRPLTGELSQAPE